MIETKERRTNVIARINARLLETYKGQTVRLTAKVIKLDGETATVEASDGGQVSSSCSSYCIYFISVLLLLRQNAGTSRCWYLGWASSESSKSFSLSTASSLSHRSSPIKSQSYTKLGPLPSNWAQASEWVSPPKLSRNQARTLTRSYLTSSSSYIVTISSYIDILATLG